MNLSTVNCFISTLTRRDVHYLPPSYGMNAAFADFTLRVVIAKLPSIRVEIYLGSAPGMTVCQKPATGEVDIHTNGEPGSIDSNSGAGAGDDELQQVTPSSNEEDPDDVISFTPVPLVGDNLVSWLAAARQHSSWKDCVVENMSWDGTAAENIDKYQREVGVEKGL